MPDAPSDRDGAYSGCAFVTDDDIWFYYTGNVRDGDGDGTLSGRLSNQTRMRSYNGINLGPKEVVLGNSGYPAYCSCHVRDPKVWEQDGRMHMMLGARTRLDARGAVLCYASDDGERWGLEGSVTNEGAEFGYMWECPDRIVLGGHEFLGCCPQGTESFEFKCQNVHSAGYFPVRGTILDLMHEDAGLMSVSAPHATSQTAISTGGFVEWDHGFDFYACQTFVDEKDRTLLVGWMSLPHDKNDVRPYDNPTDTWRGALTVPRELTLGANGRILQNPVSEIDALRGGGEEFAGAVTLFPKVADVVLEGVSGDGAVRFGDFLELRISEGVVELAFADDTEGQGRTVRRAWCGDVHDVRVLVDTSILEIYLNGGETVFGTRYFDVAESLVVTADIACERAVAYPMRPIGINYVVDR